MQCNNNALNEGSTWYMYKSLLFCCFGTIAVYTNIINMSTEGFIKLKRCIQCSRIKLNTITFTCFKTYRDSLKPITIVMKDRLRKKVQQNIFYRSSFLCPVWLTYLFNCHHWIAELCVERCHMKEINIIGNMQL